MSSERERKRSFINNEQHFLLCAGQQQKKNSTWKTCGACAHTCTYSHTCMHTHDKKKNKQANTHMCFCKGANAHQHRVSERGQIRSNIQRQWKKCWHTYKNTHFKDTHSCACARSLSKVIDTWRNPYLYIIQCAGDPSVSIVYERPTPLYLRY